MRIMVLGAGGFIGRQIVSELLGAGHEVVGVARSKGALGGMFPEASFVALGLDLATMLSVKAWTPHLLGIDAVVNAAGVLRGRDLEAIHVAMPHALHAAAKVAAVGRVVLISAISAREDVATTYAATKLAGEAALRDSGLDWTILRPSLVYGEGSYGGTSLIRGMAGLPLIVPLPGDGHFAFTPIHVRDLARAVRVACESPALAHSTLEPVGPETLDLREILARYRSWLGFGSVQFVSLPLWLMRLMGRLGDCTRDGPISTISLEQTFAGNAGDSAGFARTIGFAPRSMDDALRDSPAQVQDRWHARLFFFAPALKVVLVLMWLASAWLGWRYGAAETDAVVKALRLPTNSSDPLRFGSCLLDLAIAAMLVFSRSIARVTVAQLVVVAGYSLVLGWALPALWLEPLGPLLKNLPIMLAIATYGVIGDQR